MSVIAPKSGMSPIHKFYCKLFRRAFALAGSVILGVDDTIERRRGKHIKAKGIYWDPVRSSDAHSVNASGLRWLSLMFLTSIPRPHLGFAVPDRPDALGTLLP